MEFRPKNHQTPAVVVVLAVLAVLVAVVQVADAEAVTDRVVVAAPLVFEAHLAPVVLLLVVGERLEFARLRMIGRHLTRILWRWLDCCNSRQRPYGNSGSLERLPMYLG